MGENIREIALDSMLEIMEHDKFCHVVVNDTLTKYQYLDKKDRAFYSRLVQGTCENLIYIDYVVNSFSKVKVKKMKPLIRNNIRLAVYQIIFMKSVPDSAACNEAVKLATKRGFSGLKGFVNGVLRNISREYTLVKLPDENKNMAQYISVKYSVPEWITGMWLEQYGKDKTYKMCEAVNNVNDISVRVCVNPKNIDQKFFSKVVASLENDNVTVKPATYNKEALRLSNVDHITKLDAFNKGEIYVQDESSMLVGHIANIKKGDTVLDICAAPGGKTLHAASFLDGTGNVISRDISDDKAEKIYDNVQRCGYENVEVQVCDATWLDETMIDSADVVLADVPCSGLGIIGQKADIRYKTTMEDIESLVNIQRTILTNAVRYVKKNGTLIFSTCTVNKFENEDNVKWIEENSDLKLESIEEYIPEILHNDTTSKGYITLMPGVNDCHGFFIARFVRR